MCAPSVVSSSPASMPSSVRSSTVRVFRAERLAVVTEPMTTPTGVPPAPTSAVNSPIGMRFIAAAAVALEFFGSRVAIVERQPHLPHHGGNPREDSADRTHESSEHAQTRHARLGLAHTTLTGEEGESRHILLERRGIPTLSASRHSRGPAARCQPCAGTPSSSSRCRMRCSISSRTGRTPSRVHPAGSASFHSS